MAAGELPLAGRISGRSDAGRGQPHLDLLLLRDGGAVTILSASHRRATVPAGVDGAVDRMALTRVLEEIKDSFPDEDTVAVHISDSTSLQNLIDALDAARSSDPTAREGRRLFPDAVLVASPERP